MDFLREQNYSGWIIMENLYEKRPENTFETDVYELFRKDVNILKKAAGRA